MLDPISLPQTQTQTNIPQVATNIAAHQATPANTNNNAINTGPDTGPDTSPTTGATPLALGAHQAAPAKVSGPSQSTEIVRSNLAASVEDSPPEQKALPPTDRTLVPYGVTMLPNGKPDTPATFAEPAPAKTLPESDTTSGVETGS